MYTLTEAAMEVVGESRIPAVPDSGHIVSDAGSTSAIEATAASTGELAMQDLRAELEALSIGALMRRSRDVGVDENELWNEQDESMPKKAIIELIIAATRSGTHLFRTEHVLQKQCPYMYGCVVVRMHVRAHAFRRARARVAEAVQGRLNKESRPERKRCSRPMSHEDGSWLNDFRSSVHTD
jgi:hypothetical protein